MTRMILRTIGVLATLAFIAGVLALAAETAAFAHGAPQKSFTEGFLASQL